MSEIIYPRSPRETMAGWAYLPRFLDKVRLHLAGQLHADYQENFAHKGFDAKWLAAAGLAPEQFLAVVANSVTDGQVCDWVAQQVKKTEAEKAAFNAAVLNYGREGEEVKARLQWRKEQAGLGQRADLRTFVDFIDADERRL